MIASGLEEQDRAEQTVSFKQNLVEESLKTTPHSIKVFERSGDLAMTLEGEARADAPEGESALFYFRGGFPFAGFRRRLT